MVRPVTCSELVALSLEPQFLACTLAVFFSKQTRVYWPGNKMKGQRQALGKCFHHFRLGFSLLPMPVCIQTSMDSAVGNEESFPVFLIRMISTNIAS